MSREFNWDETDNAAAEMFKDFGAVITPTELSEPGNEKLEPTEDANKNDASIFESFIPDGAAFETLGDDLVEPNDELKEAIEKAKQVVTTPATITAEPPKTEEVDTTAFFTANYKDLKEKGIINIDLPEDEVITQERFFELQEQELDNRVNNVIEAVKKQMGNEGEAFMVHLRAGKPASEFFAKFKDSATLEVMPVETPEQKKGFIKGYLTQVEGRDAVEVEDLISLYEDKDKLEVYAAKYKGILETKRLKAVEDAKAAAIAATTKEKADRVERVDKIKTTLENAEEVQGIPLSKQDKTGLMEFLTTAKKIQGFDVETTAFNAKLTEVFNDPIKLLALAKILKDDFKLESVKKAVASDTTKKIQTELEKQAAQAAGKLKSTTTPTPVEGVDISTFF